MSEQIVKLLIEIRDELRMIRAGKRPVEIADDADLDSSFGDEEIKFDPRNWTGDPCKGKRMSETSPEFLDRLAESFDFFAKNNAASNAKTTSGKDKATYDRRSAARARGWAARLRAGWTRPAGAAEAEAPASDAFAAF